MSKSGTSAAILTGCADASKVRMGPTPLRPRTHADQKSSLPTPLGATTPNPVTTTLRMALLRRGVKPVPRPSPPDRQTGRRPLRTAPTFCFYPGTTIVQAILAGKSPDHLKHHNI